MKKTIRNYQIFSLTTLALLLLMSCGQDSEQKVTITELTKNQQDNPFNKNQEHFDITFQIEKIDKEHYNLTTFLKMDSGCYVVSPYSPDTTLLPFNLSIQKNNYLTTDSTVIEFPVAIEEHDSILESNVIYVRENTTYIQQLKINSQNDFEVAGKVELLIEPSCVPFEIDFIILNQSGELTITKTKTTSLL